MRISVVIPTLDEEANLEALLPSLVVRPGVECVVADGGSADGTRETASRLGARVVEAPRGRARQMNAGAAVATGGILLFLHADTRLPDGFDARVREVLARPGVAAGAFRLGIDAHGIPFRLLELAVDLRSRLQQRPYGDQAIFVRADVFRQVGGFPDMPILEDLAFVRLLRACGRIEISPARVSTSARRWIANGVWRTTLCNQGALWAWRFGASPERISAWYRRLRPKGKVAAVECSIASPGSSSCSPPRGAAAQ